MPSYTIGNSDLQNAWGNSASVVSAPDDAKIDTGWEELEYPNPYFMNSVLNQANQKVNHILKNGTALWNAGTSYDAGNSVTYLGELFKSLTTNLNSIPSRASIDWVPFEPLYTTTDTAINVSVNGVTNTVDFTLPSTNLVNKFENTNNITWSEDAGKVKASYVIPDIDADRKDIVLTVADDGKEIFANADTVKVNITLPLFSTLPDNWEVKLYVFDTHFVTYPDNLNYVTLTLQGSDVLQRVSGTYSGSYKIRSPNSVVYIRKRSISTSFFLEGVLRNEWVAACSYNNIDFPAEGGLIDVILTERSDDRLCDLNFTIAAGIIGGGPEWSIIDGHFCKAFVIDFTPLNNLINKYTTASAIRGYTVTPVLIAPNLGNGGKGTAVTTSTSLVSTSGAAGSQTNQIEVALQTPTTTRTGDNTLLNIQLTFQNWTKRT